MHIDIITVLPELLEGPLNHSILKRAQDKKLAEIVVHNLRDYSTNKHRRVDDYPFGGSAGMVMQVEPIDRIISKLKSFILLPMAKHSINRWQTLYRYAKI